KADEQLLQKQLELILAATGDGVYGLDCDGLTTFSNPAAERLTGYSAEEMLGVGSHGLIHHTHADGSHFPKEECPIYAAFKDGKVHRVTDQVFWRKDGSSFPVEYISTPIIDDGQIVGAVVAFNDITERKQAEAALLESEERYRKIVEATHELIFLINAEDGAILDVNEEACQMLNYSKSELTAKSIEDLHDHEMPQMRRFMADIRANGRSKTDRLSCLSANGDKIPVRMSASLLQLQGKECVLVMAQDLREYVEAERQSRKLQNDLHHVSRLSAMGEMASGMAHELNQPLTAVMNYLQACQIILASDKDDHKDKVADYMTKAIDQAERAGKIISGLRTFVQKGEVKRTLENLNKIVDEASNLVVTGAPTDGIEFKLDLADDLPLLCVDKIQIQQVIFNLVRNAVEALAQTENAKVTIATARLDDCVTVRIQDNGPGVDDEFQGKLFDAFVTTKTEGMGVGLSICQSIIEGHCGQITARRNPDAGMSFAFKIPISEEKSGDE
ncbi:MAG: two-component system sensor kinase FixL, partial [Paracoccaceae bacterium]